MKIREQNDANDKKLQDGLNQEQQQKQLQEEYEKMEQQYEAAKEERYRLFVTKQEERKKIEQERVQEKNDKTIDNLHKRLCFLTQN